MFFDNNYNIFLNVEMGGNYILGKYLLVDKRNSHGQDDENHCLHQEDN
jgi:hypothetical protein